MEVEDIFRAFENGQFNPDQFIARIELNFSRLSANQLVDFLNLLAHNRRPRSLTILNQWFYLTTRQIRFYDPEKITNVISDLALLNVKPESQWLTEWYQRSQEIFNQFSLRQINELLQSLAKLNLSNPFWLLKWEKNTVNKIKFFTPQELADSVYFLGQLGAGVDYTWLNEWFLQSVDNFSTQDFYRSLYGLALLRVDINRKWLDRWYQATSKEMEFFSPQSYSSLIFPFTMIDIKVNLDWLSVWYQASLRKMEDFEPEDYAETIYAIGIIAPKIYLAWLNKWFDSSIIKLGDFDPHQLVITIEGLSKLKVSIYGAWMQNFFLESQKKLKDFSLKELKDIMYYLKKIGFPIRTSWFDEWEAQIAK